LRVVGVEEVWREEWGRLLALLVARYRRLDLAEDGLGDAFEAAARKWPSEGTPANPAAWLLTAARNRIIDRLRAEAVAARRMPVLVVEAELTEEAQRVMADAGDTRRDPGYDERLRLVLLCAHPVLAPESAAALSLRLVMGVSTEDLARLFLVPTPTMAARLTRARKRLARERFELPEGPELDQRLALAMDIAYLAFTAGYAPGSGPEVLRPAQAAQAVRLARTLREVAPPGVELDALLALMLLQHSRRDARVDEQGELVLLPDQDRSRWHRQEIAEAVDLLTPWAHAPGTPYLLQALIAAEHSIAATPAATDWPRIAARYRELDELTGSPVVRLNRAVAVAEADGPQAGLALLDGLHLAGHRLPAVRGQLLLRLGRDGEAREQLREAIARCGNEPERAALRRLLPTDE
jgi:RNA polymerase sigma-70 factor (ECF subfamily)